jgi:hypothetical protein
MIDNDRFKRFQAIYPDAVSKTEAGTDYVYVPKLKLPDGTETKALLCPMQNGGYTTRLFLAIRPNKPLNWTQHVILGESWSTWSWNNIAADRELIDILRSHLDPLK